MSSRRPKFRHALLLVLLAGASSLAPAVIIVHGSRTLRVGQSVVLRAERPGHPGAAFVWHGNGGGRASTSSESKDPYRFDATAEGEFPILVEAQDDPHDQAELVLLVLPREGGPLPPSGRRLWSMSMRSDYYRDPQWEPGKCTVLVGAGNQLRRFDAFEDKGKGETVLDLDETPVAGLVYSPQVEQVCQASDGCVFLTVWEEEADDPEPQVWCVEPDGRLILAASRVEEPEGEGDDPEQASLALEGKIQTFAGVPYDLDPRELVAGPDGACYLTDWCQDQVLRLSRPKGGDFELTILAGRPREASDLLDHKAYRQALGDCQDARQAVLAPQGLALAPDGSLVVLDRRHSRVCRLQRRAGDGPETWELTVLYTPGQEDPDRPGQPFPTGVPRHDFFRLMVDGLGYVYLAGENGGRFWASTTRVGAEPGGLSFVPIAGTDPQFDAKWEEGAAAERLDTPLCVFMTPVPGGGVVLAGDHQPLRYLGPPSDAHLVPRLEAHARAEADGKGCEAARILDGLRKHLPDEQRRFTVFLAPLTRRGDVLDWLVSQDRIPSDVVELIKAFVLDPRSNAFRASLAVRQVRTRSPFERARQQAEEAFRLLPPPEQPEAGEMKSSPSGSKRARTEDDAKGPSW